MSAARETSAFDGFPGIGKATAIPNVYFEALLPRLTEPGSLLAFLWVSRLAQARTGDARFATAEEVWANAAARQSFEQLGRGKRGLEAGLRENVELGAMLALPLQGRGAPETLYFVNNPSSRRAIARARAGQLQLVPNTVALDPVRAERPGIFTLYEEHIGTITPLVAERLVAAADVYEAEWIEDAFREAAERNVRNWRYVERILETWAQEGRDHEGTAGDSFEEQKRRYLGGNFGTSTRR